VGNSYGFYLVIFGFVTMLCAVSGIFTIFQ
jgi:hypothetical protein